MLVLLIIFIVLLVIFYVKINFEIKVVFEKNFDGDIKMYICIVIISDS